MNYEFHIGDYVETKTGVIGYISNVAQNSFTFTSKDGIIIGPWTWNIPDEPYHFICNHFNRIGQYDFTKKAEDKDNDKIEPLVKSRLLETADGEYECYFDSREVIEKINELVEGVNRLEEKVNGMA